MKSKQPQGLTCIHGLFPVVNGKGTSSLGLEHGFLVTIGT
jgi:hypothetical protein